MSIIGFILVVFEIILTIFNHYKPSKNYPQTLKFISFLAFIVGLILILSSVIAFFNC
nr:hypothetical protein [Lactobacillus helveticus]